MKLKPFPSNEAEDEAEGLSFETTKLKPKLWPHMLWLRENRSSFVPMSDIAFSCSLYVARYRKCVEHITPDYRKFSNRGATPYRGAPSFLAPRLLGFWTFSTISQLKIVRFSICKKPLEGEIALSLMRAPPKGFPKRPAPLLGNLR